MNQCNMCHIDDIDLVPVVYKLLVNGIYPHTRLYADTYSRKLIINEPFGGYIARVLIPVQCRLHFCSRRVV